MKGLLLCVGCIFLVTALFSNPITAEVVSELWFSAEGHLMMEFCKNYDENTFPVNLSDIHLVNDAMDVTIPHSGAIGYGYPFVVDITSLLPDFTLNPIVDTLRVYFDNGHGFAGNNYYVWGNCANGQITSLAPGQSAVRVHTMWGFVLAKDEPPTPGTNPYTPVATDSLIVFVTDQNGNPVSNVGVSFSISWLFYYTDDNGLFTVTMPACHCLVRVLNPQTNTMVYEQWHYLEPHQTTLIPVTINITANDDEVIPMVVKGLKAYPSPFNAKAADYITFSYEGKEKLSRNSYVRLHDAKGRFIRQIKLDSQGMAQWQPSSDMGSGMYFARLISGNRIVDTTIFSIIK